MLNTLCLETSGAYCSLAVRMGGQVFVRHEHLVRRHNERLLEALDDLLNEAGAQRGALAQVVFSEGPGSFTGIRLGAAAAQAIALAEECSVVGMSSSLVLAHSAHVLDTRARDIVTSIRSRGEACYLARYRVAEAGVTRARDDTLMTEMDDWLTAALEEGACVVGDVPSWLEADGFGADGFEADGLAVNRLTAQPHAASMLALAAQHEADLPRPGVLALPRYLEGDSPWRKRAERASAEQAG